MGCSYLDVANMVVRREEVHGALLLLYVILGLGVVLLVILNLLLQDLSVLLDLIFGVIDLPSARLQIPDQIP